MTTDNRGEYRTLDLALGQTLTNVHPIADCHPPCPIDAPSDHHMVDWPKYWKAGMQRICEHDVMHRDPDSLFFDDLVGCEECDGCCGVEDLPDGD